MNDDHRKEITRRMSALRTQGTRAAAQLPRDLDRARDWREHVRAHPIPSVLAAAALGFMVVPGRRPARVADSRSRSVAAEHHRQDQSTSSEVAAKAKPGLLSSPIIATVGAWAGRWALGAATGALQRFATDHIQSFPTTFGKHGSASPQRRGDTAEQPRVYSQ
jgi:hypothetical protein